MRHSALTVAVAAVAAVVLAGCGGGGSSTSTGAGAPSASTGTSTGPVAQVPEGIRSKGTLTVAADATYAPMEFIGTNGTTVEGLDADLAQAIGQKLNLQVKVVNATFDNIIPGLASGKYDMGMSSFTDTKEREKTVDFVTYFSAGTSFYVKSPGGPTINTLADLCGQSVAVERGTTQADDANAQSKKCTGQGQPAVRVSVFPDQNGANLALSSGRAKVGMADSPVAAYIVKQANGQFKLTGQPYNSAPYGIALPKGNGMAEPVLEAVKAIVGDGTYTTILGKWGVAEGAISNPAINNAQR